MKILVIAGTEDARLFVRELAKLSVDITVTVTTDYGASLIESQPNVAVEIGKWDDNKMQHELAVRAIELLVDASHPYAHDDIDLVVDYQQAVELCNQYEGNILLTIGSNLLPTFAEGVEGFSDRVFARILSTHTMVKRAQELGLSPKHILALQGPFSKAINKAMIDHVDAKIMVTKASGSIGGTLEKIEAAREMGLKIIVIDRPTIEYGAVFSDSETLIKAVKIYLID